MKEGFVFQAISKVISNYVYPFNSQINSRNTEMNQGLPGSFVFCLASGVSIKTVSFIKINAEICNTK